MINVTQLSGFGSGGDLKYQLIGLSPASTPKFTSPCSWASATSVPNLILSDWISPELLHAGQQFTVVVNILPYSLSGEPFACTSWPQYPVLTSNFTYGTPLVVTAPRVARKQWYTRCAYDGNDTVTATGYYSGDDTNSEWGGQFIESVVFHL